MSFVRSSTVTYKVAVPVLLAGLLATGIVFLEVSPANAAACSTTASGYADGDGTSGDPFQISNAAELIRLSTTTLDWSKHFVQMADINLSDCQWSPIGNGTNKFTGSYNGSGFAIQGFNLNNTTGAFNYDGLFGSLSSASVQNLILVGRLNSVSRLYVGGLAGDVGNSSLISKVLVQVDITYSGDGYLGGLVGNFDSGTIRYSAYLGSIGSSNSVAMTGSFTGATNLGNTVDSYARATMSGATPTKGGMNGFQNVRVSRGYAASTGANFGITANNAGTTTMSNSFWDTTLSTTNPRPDGSPITGATGKTTAQMTDISTYTAAGWDIVSGWEAFSTSGTPKIWGICSQENNGYPFLLWEYSTNPCASLASAPSITSVTPASSSGSLSVAFSAPTSDGNLAITNYKYSIDNGATWVTRSPISTTSPLVIQGLTNGTSYQIKLLAINSLGDGSASIAVSGTPLTTSSAPTITSITASSGALSLAFTAPTSNGGAPISNYKYSLDNGATWITRSPASTSSPLAITGLTNGTSYQVKLLAVNSQGDGAASSAATGTPVAPSPTTSAAPATTAASLTAPAATLAVTGSNLLGNWGFVVATLFVGLALVLISGARRREPEQEDS